MYLPPELRDFQIRLAGELLLLDEPGDHVKSLRNRYGFTQRWLAGILDMRRESLSRIESGHVNLSPTFIRGFVRVITLARSVRREMANAEMRDRGPDDRALTRLATRLGYDGDTADEIILASMINYGRKREEAIRDLGLQR